MKYKHKTKENMYMFQEEKRIKKLTWRNPHLWYITVIMIVLAIFYYLPSIITFMGGKVPNWVILNIPYDLYRSLFFIPALYAAYKFRIKGVIALSSISMLIFLLRALSISPYPFSLIRPILFIVSLFFSGFFFAASLNNIDERKRVEEALQESKRILAQVIQENSIPTFAINKEHIITHWNKALEVLTGFSAEEMVGTRKQWRAFYTEGRPCMADFIVDEVSENIVIQRYGNSCKKSSLISGAYESENFFPNIGENGRWLHFTAAPIHNQKGSVIEAIETLEDITEHKKAYKELIAAKTYTESIIQNFLDTLIVVDTESKIKTVNPETCHLLGYTEEELIKQPISMIFAEEEEEEVKHFFQFFRDPQNKKALDPHDTIRNRELTYKTKDGQFIPMSFNASVLTDEADNVTGVVAGAKDLTEIKQAEKERLRVERHYRDVIEKVFKFVPEGLLVFADKLNLLKENKTFQNIVKEYSAKLNYTKQELREIIIEQVKNRIVNEDHAEIRIGKKAKSKEMLSSRKDAKGQGLK